MHCLKEWLLDAPEDLDVFVAQRAFASAVELSVKSKAALASIPESTVKTELASSIANRIQSLVCTLSVELERPALRRQAIRSTVQLLLELGEEELACRTYLANRSNAIRRDFRKLKMEGSTELYVYKLARTFFQTLRTACAEFQEIFSVGTSSIYISWAKTELSGFVAVFSRQVFRSSTTSFSTTAECVQCIVEACVQVGRYLSAVKTCLINVRIPNLTCFYSSGGFFLYNSLEKTAWTCAFTCGTSCRQNWKRRSTKPEKLGLVAPPTSSWTRRGSPRPSRATNARPLSHRCGPVVSRIRTTLLVHARPCA